MKQWLVAPLPPQEFLNAHPELPPLVARLLWNRGLREQEKIDEFLNPDYLADIHDPFLFRDMKKAVDLIFKNIDKQKNIVVHGDYDADGVCASAILVSTLKKLGAKNVGVFIPHREIDGYGLNPNTIKTLKEQKTDLLITCDCGVSNAEETRAAKKAGLTVIITDHHSVPAELPPADAIIHVNLPDSKYPDKGLAGAAVAFKLAQALLKKHQEKTAALPDGQTHEGFEKWLLDLVAIATIGDMVPLFGESRTLARYGLTVLNKTRNLGLRELLLAAGLTDETGRPRRGALDARAVGYSIVPRLNAAGRMDHANSAFALLMADDEKIAKELALQLNKNNSDRQRLTEQMVDEAKAQIKETKQETAPMIFVFNEKWPSGVIGLVSGKLKDIYNKPAIAMNKNEEGEISGSGRSVLEFNIIAALQEMSDYFSKFGGHPQACGFSLKSAEQLDEFKKTLTKKVADALTGVDTQPKLAIDAEVDLEEVDWKLYDLLQKFEPFGQGNEEPRYLASGLTVTEISPVGQDGRHLRLMVKHNSHTIKKTIAFGFGDVEKHPMDWKKILQPGDKIDMVFTVSVNEWNGNRELELAVEDIRKTE